MKTTAINTLCILVCCCSFLTASAQVPKLLYSEVFPELPFSLKQVKEKGYQKVVIWYNEYTKAEGDESGMPWSNNTVSYQWQRHVLPGGQLDRSTWYFPDNNKEKALQYYYIGNRVSAIDELAFDTLQKEYVVYSYNFAYKDTIPFQKVKLHDKDKQFRILYDYLYDKEGRLVREHVTPQGQAKKMETVVGLEYDNQLVLTAYNGDSKTRRYYQNMHDLIRSERTQFTETGQMINMRVKNGENLLIADVVYSYEGEQLVKETYTTHDGTQLIEDKVIHYRYDADGLIEQKIIEKGDLQIIYSYQYSQEY